MWLWLWLSWCLVDDVVGGLIAVVVVAAMAMEVGDVVVVVEMDISKGML